jgi:hypothetical protein
MMLEWLIQAGSEAALTVAMRRRRTLRRAVYEVALLVLALILGFGFGGQ